MIYIFIYYLKKIHLHTTLTFMKRIRRAYGCSLPDDMELKLSSIFEGPTYPTSLMLKAEDLCHSTRTVLTRVSLQDPTSCCFTDFHVHVHFFSFHLSLRFLYFHLPFFTVHQANLTLLLPLFYSTQVGVCECPLLTKRKYFRVKLFNLTAKFLY